MKKFLMNATNINRDSVVWNMIGSILNAFQSVIMLMILTRTVGLVESGVFTIAYANANLFLTIGKYGMRSYQVSDLKHQFSFSDYKVSRVITSCAMIICFIMYTLYASFANEYSLKKSIVILLMCFLKVIDSIEDIFHGQYHQYDRLDVAGKAMSLRMIVTIMIFAISLLFSKDLVISLIITILISMGTFVFLTKMTIGIVPELKIKYSMNSVGKLLKTCFPLFVGSFLSFYIGNAPKYAIDANLSDELQACYGFISMPVFVIGLLNGFIFNPMLYKMSMFWQSKNIKQFILKTIRQVGIILLITLICIVGAYVLGIPVLSVIYNTNLRPYKLELLILLLGGGLLSLSGLLHTVITIMRYQKWLMVGYVLIALTALMLSNYIVLQYELLGASLLYVLLMGGLCLIFGIMFTYGIIREQKGV